MATMDRKTVTMDFVIARTIAHNRRVAHLLNRPILDLEIRFRKGMSLTVGYAETDSLTLTYSSDLIKKERSALFDWVCGHEVIHCYADRHPNGRYYCDCDGRPHGNRWKRLMVIAGLPPLVGYSKLILRKYTVNINPDWGTYSLKKLSSSYTNIVNFDSKKIRNLYGAHLYTKVD